MDSLVVPGLDTLRQWLDELGISFFECDSCQALHLPHMQNFEGIFDAKLDLVDNVVLFSALAEVSGIDRRRRRDPRPVRVVFPPERRTDFYGYP